MKKYNSFKDSGIDWLGEIPEHWGVKNLKRTGYSFEVGKREQSIFKGVISIGGEHIQEETFHTTNLRYVSLEFFNKSKRGKIKKGDILLVKDGATIGKAMYVNFLLSDKMMLNEHVYRIEANKYFYYVIISPQTQFQFWMSNQSSAQESINSDTLKSFVFCWPKEYEQTAIANYLDRKTAEIDKLVADKKRLIELYEEEKQAIINQAVTKGINPDVKMKDSGVEWLGDIPEHWEVKRIDRIADIVRGNTGFKKDELLAAGEYVALQYGKTYKVNEVNDSFSFYVNSEFYKPNQIVQYGDVILISTSETLEDLGHSCFYARHDLGLLGGEQILLRPTGSSVSGKYLFYSSKVFFVLLRKFASGIKVFRFNIDNLKEMCTVIPPIEEQKSIIHHIETECALIDAKKVKTEKLIELLTEYRTALISEVVTGKVKVV